jgi:hypothetical protein
MFVVLERDTCAPCDAALQEMEEEFAARLGEADDTIAVRAVT